VTFNRPLPQAVLTKKQTMNKILFNRALALFLLLLIGNLNPLAAQTPAKIERKDIEAHMEFLAGDALQGRGSGTQFELIAGTYFASLMKQFGVKPAGDTDSSGRKTYIQTITTTRNSFNAPPVLSYRANGADVKLTHGAEMLIYRIAAASVSGSLEKIGIDDAPQAGAVSLIRVASEADEKNLMQNIGRLLESDAAAVIVEETAQFRGSWQRFAARPVSFSNASGKTAPAPALIVVSKDAAAALGQTETGTKIEIGGKLNEPETRRTWNAVGLIDGADAKLASEVVLLSAHMDHLGVRENAPGEDKIFNGADDDASGCVAVLELARILAAGPKPKRTVYFAFFGSEEAGGTGSRYFVDNLPFPKENLIANLQWEMIGRPDAKVKKDELWLTGYERSNLGAELAKRGAKLVADPHPEQNFFQRSDNYNLARQGIVAHTVSSFGLHPDYHQASDELDTIDFEYMTNAVNSMIEPVRWLLDSDFKPDWNEGQKP
jgi:aminopeptidase YwaD